MRTSTLILLLTLAVSLAAQTTMPSFWHTYEEITNELLAWEQLYPEICHVESIGVTNGAAYQEPIPIWALKISDNADVDEDEPALLFVGQCHAEEVLGNEIVMLYIQRMLECQTQWPYSEFISDLEVWFVPTINPEGLHVVMHEGDDSYRKTKRDNDLNDVFDFVVGTGNDWDGVDPNRNYDFCWERGHYLGCELGDELYDYYRGPAPFSEGGTYAISQLGRREKFIYSINYHSSRTGYYSERVFYPWEFAGLANRRSPDYDIASEIGETIAAMTPRYGGEPGYYEPSGSQGRLGKSTQWFYAALNTYQLTIEVSLNQPDSTAMFDIVMNNHNGMTWLMKRALNGVLDTSPMLRGRVVDATTGAPLEAEYIIAERNSPYFEPRYTDVPHGRFFRPISSGTYTLTVKKPGYHTQTRSVVVNPSGWSQNYLFEMQPVAVARFTGSLQSDNSSPLNGEIVLHGEHGTETFVIENGVIDITVWEGVYEMEVYASGHTRMMRHIIAAPGEHDLDIELEGGVQFLYESFDDSTNCAFTTDEPWEFIDELAHEGMAITDSWDDEWGFYAMYCDVNITTTDPVSISGDVDHATLEWWEHVYTEPNWDFCTVDVSADGENWTTLYSISGKHDEWNRRIVSLDDYIGQSIYVRFRLTDDSPNDKLVDLGWTIDDVFITGGSGTITDVNDNTQTPAFTRLQSNYPNPFNPETTFRFSLSANAQQAEMRIYNIRGKLVDVLPIEEQQRQLGEVHWNASEQASGVYLYRLRVDGVDYPARKACLLK